MRVNTRTVIVEWGHCDPGAIVYFPRYFEWFDAGTAALFEDAGIPKAAMLSRYGCAGIPVVDLRTRFIKPSTFGDRVIVETSITAWRRSGFDLTTGCFAVGNWPWKPSSPGCGRCALKTAASRAERCQLK
jgi:4-hydroxybenzoyl-CoA thioesterase